MTILYLKLTYDQSQVKQERGERMSHLVRRAITEYFNANGVDIKLEEISDLEIEEMSRMVKLEEGEVAYVALTDAANKFLAHATNKFGLPAKTVVASALAAFDLMAMLIEGRIRYDQQQEKGD